MKAWKERNLNIIESKTIKNLPKKEEGLKDDFEFYKALYHGDKTKMEEILEKLISPKIHKKRNDNPVLNKYRLRHLVKQMDLQ